MKKCAYCGHEYPDENLVCPVDGERLQAVVPPPPVQPVVTDRQSIIDGEHIKLLAIFHFVVAGLALLGEVFLALHFLIMRMVFTNPELWKSQANNAPPPEVFFYMMIMFYCVFGVIFLTVSVLNLLSGLFLRRRKNRIFSLVVGGLNCVQIPFGTVLGVFTLIVLMRSSVRDSY
jgi:hypothetical protein